MSIVTVETKKEDLRKVLERNGSISQLRRVLVGLYEHPVRPADPMEYIRQHLGAPTGLDVEALRSENEELRRRNEELQGKAEDIAAQVEQLRADMEER